MGVQAISSIRPGVLAAAAAALIVFSAVSISEGIYLVLVGSGVHSLSPPRPHMLTGGSSLLVLGGVKLFGGVSLLYYSRMGAQMAVAAMVSDFAVILLMGFAQLLLIHVFLAAVAALLLARCWRYLV